jgi:N-sulfoglucosamine sulfohydrolase
MGPPMRLALLFLIGSAAPAAAGPKNVVVIIADDLGRELGCYGDPVAKTPHLDKLAASGTRFTHAFASVASCSPSRAAMLTGQPTHQCGQYGLAHGTHNTFSFATAKGLPALLKPAGYRTASVGKLHVQPKAVYPFDAEIGGNARNPVAMAEACRKWLAEAPDKPFFLWVGFTDPHRAATGYANDGKYPADVPRIKFDPKAVPVPNHLPDTPEVRADLADYYQSVARLDDGVGRVLKVLADSGKADDTLVVFLSDNGIPFPGAKTTLYDAGIRLPLIVRKPGQAATVSDAMVSWTDLAPTVLDWCGLPAHKPHAGRSFLPVLEQKSPAGWDAVFASHQWHEVTMYYPMRAVRTRTHKLIVNLAHPLEVPSAEDLWKSPTWQTVLSRKLPMLGKRPTEAFLHRPAVELYDLTADPDEVRNVAAESAQAATLADLRRQLEGWRTRTADPWRVKATHE